MIDDEAYSAEMISHILQKDGYKVILAQDLSTVMQVIAERDVHLVLLDLVLSHPSGKEWDYSQGLALVEEMKRQRPDVPIIVYSAYLTAMKHELPAMGAYAFVNKASPPVEIRQLIRKAIEEYELRKLKVAEHSKLSEQVRGLLLDQIEKYAPVKERTIHIADEVAYELIKPLIGFKRDIEHQLSRSSFAENVFLMMKFRDVNLDLGQYIVENLKKDGFRGVRADHDEWNLTGNVYNPIAVLYCCKYGIALFDEPEEHQAYSPNVAYELGMMHYQNKNCLILRHSSRAPGMAHLPSFRW